MMASGWVIAIVVLFVGYGIIRAIEAGLKTIAERIDNNSHQLDRMATRLDRVGTKLDNLWTPLQGISNATHGKLGDDENDLGLR